MTCHVSPAQLVEILQATPLNYLSRDQMTIAARITTDSRALQAGEVFLALRGETFDGHTFVQQAIEQGAITAVVDHVVSGAEALPLLVVKDTLVAYQAIAHWWRNRFTIPLIAVTGSVGKTTTKELIAAVLATQGTVFKTYGNFNNEIGVPKTLLDLSENHDYAVIEMGMRGLGEIALLSQIARPDIAVITNVGTAHIGRLGSEQAIATAKCELLAEMPVTGVAVLNHDNARLTATAAQVWQGKTLTYGLEGGDIHGQLLDPQTLVVEGMTFPLPLPGRHNALNYLAALTVANVLGIDWSPLMKGVTVELPKGRARRYDLPQDVVLLDETYNAGLESMLASLHLLSQTSGRRRIAVLGTMKELGERSPEFHHQVGVAVRDLNLDHLLILADEEESQAMAKGANPTPTEQLSSHDEVVERLLSLIKPGDRVLLKASRAVGLDQVVDRVRETWIQQSS
ncbi:UDP-N-acetylmuramoyl-tripeptide--D-alanyl-D-alanine ligase [Oscillatoria sp. FACHB-1407]|uniref:UDP-N-acetylmuramoyl-tripeptide--D-alanyl-D- alanine ligase n=1 Tax=Oscillatoria sp. FACHB-1407 TaxID=2692847 RepID=UPI001685EF7D|nr:UDP-N-acetylmuramoyl-tripeptide--D-alanyl-D-alanine ligase [Oscillatoria sp. FACHB-1407]MBD2460636.1 UDP-N-acetylmuramoyl-tripeptide--D-alanyl-D-alanine ligase [Oscillatoria sp. FACHB-1407]